MGDQEQEEKESKVERFFWLCKTKPIQALSVFQSVSSKDKYTLVSSKNENNETAFMMTCAGGHVPLLHALIDFDVDMTCVSSFSRSPMWYAATFGNLEVIKILVRLGLLIDIPTIIGETPLMSAAYHGHMEIVCILFYNGANPNRRCVVGHTALWNAAQMGYFDIVQFLSFVMTDPNQASYAGITPYNVAKENNHLGIVEFLEKFNT